MIDIIMIILAIVTLITLSYFAITNRKEIKTVKSIMMKPPAQNSFDCMIPVGGMKVINDFLNSVYLKYINSKLIQINETNELSITYLISSISNDEEMTKLVTGYVMTVDALMSKELKFFFSKYYNVIDEKGETNDNFISYVSEWFILNIRNLQAQISIDKLSSNDYSTRKELELNSRLFASIEMDLYRDLNIINDIEGGNNVTGNSQK